MFLCIIFSHFQQRSCNSMFPIIWMNSQSADLKLFICYGISVLLFWRMIKDSFQSNTTMMKFIIFSFMKIPNYFIWFVNCNPFLILNITIYLKSSNNEYLTMKKKNHMVWINKTNFILEKPLPTKFTLDKSINKRLYILILHSYRRIN